MQPAERIYRRTDAGHQAFSSQSADVPVEYRRVLEVVGTGTHAAVIRACLRSHPYEHILECLSKLEQVGLLESVPQAGAACHAVARITRSWVTARAKFGQDGFGQTDPNRSWGRARRLWRRPDERP